MLGFSKKRFFITLGVSIGGYLVGVLAQGLTLYNVSFSLSGGSCEITGFPIARCFSDNSSATLVQLVNLLFWFWLIHLIFGFLKRNR